QQVMQASHRTTLCRVPSRGRPAGVTEFTATVEAVTTFSTERPAAEAMDAADPLAGFRDRFARDDHSLIYLDGNSLGMLPLATAERLARLVREEWGHGLVRSWDQWIDLPWQAGDALGQALLGAAAGQLLVADSTTVNLY